MSKRWSKCSESGCLKSDSMFFCVHWPWARSRIQILNSVYLESIHNQLLNTLIFWIYSGYTTLLLSKVPGLLANARLSVFPTLAGHNLNSRL